MVGERANDQVSTPFKFSNVTNSRKSLLSGTWMLEVAQFDHNSNALFGAEASIRQCILAFGLREARKDSNYLLHGPILAFPMAATGFRMREQCCCRSYASPVVQRARARAQARRRTNRFRHE